MDLFECIYKRRSIRSFTGEAVSENELKKILECGISAPSAGNMQAREFIIVKSPEGRKKVCDATDAGNTSRGGVSLQRWVEKAAVIIIICYDEKRMAAKYGDKGRYTMTKLDCMGVAENMMLAVTALGLGTTCVIGFHQDQLKENIDIPPQLTPLLMLPIGRPAEHPEEVYRMPLEDVVRFEC